MSSIHLLKFGEVEMNIFYINLDHFTTTIGSLEGSQLQISFIFEKLQGSIKKVQKQKKYF